MCGIAGFCDFTKKSSQKILENMTDELHHRGPDDSGYFFNNEEGYQVGLGHKRLSILDLSNHGHQPMSFDHLEIIYNGEVYNFKEIKKELQDLNYSFFSDSDTEVIIKAYHKWGIKAVDKFIGMFSIAIYDKKNKKLVFIRDRAGVKPFFYFKKNDLILFASELKSFHKHLNFDKKINKDALFLYMQFGYIPEPYSIFENTYKLKAGHYIEIDLKLKKLEEKKYWDVLDFYSKPKLNISENEAIEKVEELLKSSFDYRMISDVPVGVFLSGGYDSSTVAAIIQNGRKEKINTFTIGFKEKGYDEAPYAKEVAKYLGTNHTEYYCTQKDALDIIPKLCKIYDEPFGDSSSIPTTLVSQLAKKHVSVSLSADGGDEVFSGYDKYTTTLNFYKKLSLIHNKLKPLIHFTMDRVNPEYIPLLNNTYNFTTRYEKVKNILKAKNITEAMKYSSEYFIEIERKKIINSEYVNLETNFDISLSNSIDDINKMLAIDYKTYLMDNGLTKVDRATMSIGLEGREPLIDHRIIEFVSQLPSNIKYKNRSKKWLLKQIAHKYLPKELMDRPKKGFSVPLTDWFRDELKEYFLIYLDEKRIEKEGLFNPKEVIKLRNSYLNGNKENVQKLWFLLMFQMWHEKWM